MARGDWFILPTEGCRIDDSAAVSEFPDDRPELESALLAVLEVNDANEYWTFDEVPVDSGAFGELVSRGFIKKTDEW